MLRSSLEVLGLGLLEFRVISRLVASYSHKPF